MFTDVHKTQFFTNCVCVCVSESECGCACVCACECEKCSLRKNISAINKKKHRQQNFIVKGRNEHLKFPIRSL